MFAKALWLGLMGLMTPAHAYEISGYDWTHQSAPIEDPFEFKGEGWPASAGSSTDLAAAFADALEVWGVQGGAKMSYTDGGTSTASSWTYDEANVAEHHASTMDTAVALAQYWADGDDYIVDCDIRFYGRNAYGIIDWSADPEGPGSKEMDLQLVAQHELGHCLGLDHSWTEGAVMYPTVNVGTSVTDRLLRSDDIDGVQAIYGRAAGAKLVYDGHDLETADNDGVLDAGDRASLGVRVHNVGTAMAREVVGILSVNSRDVTLVHDVVDLGDIATGDVAGGEVDGPSFSFEIAAKCVLDQTVTFRITLEDRDGTAWSMDVEEDIFCSDEAEESVPDCDEDLAQVYYADTDGDGFGDAEQALVSCEEPSGYVRDHTDCDDTDGDSYPGAEHFTPACMEQLDAAKVPTGCSTTGASARGLAWLLTVGLLLRRRD